MAEATALKAFFAASSRAAQLDALARAEPDPREGVLLASRAEMARIAGQRALQDVAAALDAG